MQPLSKTTGRPLDVITLRDLAVHCVIGVNPEEKLRPQVLLLDVKLYLDTSAAAMSGILSRTVDYSLVAKQLTFILTYARFRLLESAAEALAIYLLTPPNDSQAGIQAVDIEIRKPEALQGHAVPSLRIFRDAESRAQWLGLYSAGDILFQVPEAVIERKVIAPDSSFEFKEGQDHAVMTEAAGLLWGDHILDLGALLVSQQSLVLRNDDSRARSVLWVTFRGRERFQIANDQLH